MPSPEFNFESVPKNIPYSAVCDVLQRHHELVDSIEPITSGTLNLSYKLFDGSEVWGVAKLHNPNKPLEHVCFENDFCSSLVLGGLPTPKLVRTRDKSEYAVTDLGIITVHIFCEGLNYSFRDEEIEGAARMQARMHEVPLEKLAQTYPEQDFFDNPKFLVSKVEEVLRSGVNSHGNLERGLNYLSKRRKPNTMALGSKRAIHADYHPWNLKFDKNGNVCAIFDYDFVMPGRKLYDLAISLIYFGRDKSKGEFREDVANRNIRRYLGGYKEIGNLSMEELRELPFLVLVRCLDNLRRDLKRKDSKHKLTFSNLRNLAVLNWAMNLDMNGGIIT